MHDSLRLLIRELLHEAVHSSVLGTKRKDFRLKADQPVARRIEPELVDMVTKSYAAAGGNPKIASIGDISSEYEDWIVADIDDDPDVDVFVAGNPRHGMKLGVSATDGSPEAKAHMTKLKRKLFASGWWAEVSGAPAHVALNKLGVKPVEDEAKVRRLLGGKDIVWFGEHPDGKFPGTYGWYERDIGGVPHLKIVVGDV